jgi:hypothetical protein
MATKKAAPTDPPVKLTRTAITNGLIHNHDDIVNAVHRVLNKAGLDRLKVHSIRFEAEGVSGPCDPPCPNGQHCVPDSDGGTVSWVCVPD